MMLQVTKADKAIKDQQAHKVTKVDKDIKVQQAHKVTKVDRVTKARQVLKVLMQQELLLQQMQENVIYLV